ncbi:hypothetical protein H5410_045741 [Solanum commersonii]|uniref:Uncharacterized protein n=1 Tax=Solanum commersonii TaxID=4109 RepID=A0A9J5XAE2_SOLCO|nr:hypothetical protein H5410_045741 [Solanum commersonii]
MRKYPILCGRNSRQKIIFQAMPNIIMRYLLKRRDTILHGWTYYDGYRPKFWYKLVKLFPPSTGRWKCNTHGVSMGNPGLISENFCVRDSNGDILCAKSLKMVIIETYSLESVHILNGEWKFPMRVTMELNTINMIMILEP